MRYKVNVSAQIDAQMDEIADYIIHTLKAPQAAEDLLHALHRAIDSLDMMPERIPLSRHESLKALGLHCMVVRNYLIYFQIDEAERQVVVHAVIYGKRDQAVQLDGIVQN